MTTGAVEPKKGLDRSGVNRGFQLLGFVIVLGAAMFGLAGRLDWWQAWAFIGIYLGGIALNAAWLLRHNPDMINERGRMGENTKAWDKVIGAFYTALLLATFVIAGLDARFGWSAEPLWLNLVGAVGVILSLALTFWVIRVNAFLSTFVRIQEDRGQYVVSSGPYRFVRHPMYAGMLGFFPGIPLLLGSWWAWIPTLLNIIVIVIRTALEDRTLQAELPGYKEYTRRVRHRLVPGVW